jgi:hypothetical protein
MKKLIALGAAAALFAGAFAPLNASAADAKKTEAKEKSSKTRKKRDTYPYSGVIGSIEGNRITLKLKTKGRVITVADDAKITRDGKPAKLADIKAGVYVSGQVKKIDGKEVAVSVYEKPKPERKARDSSKTKGKKKDDK